MAKQKRKRMAVQKETKELKEENRRLTVLVASLQGLPPPADTTGDEVVTPVVVAKAKRPVPPLGTASLGGSAPNLDALAHGGAASPTRSSQHTNLSSSGGSGSGSPINKRWALTDDTLPLVSSSPSHHHGHNHHGHHAAPHSPLGQSMPSLPTTHIPTHHTTHSPGAPKSFVLGHRPAPPSGPPPERQASSIIFGSPPVNYLNPTNAGMPAVLMGGGGSSAHGAGAGSSPSSSTWASAGVSYGAGTPPTHPTPHTPPARTDSPLLTHTSSSGSLRMGLAKSSSGTSINSNSGDASYSGNIFGPPTDIVYATDNTIRAASLDTLIRMLPSSDANYIDTFLMTYRAFCTADELFVRLVDLWEAAASHESNETLKVFRIKFMNVIIKWIEKHGVDFDDNSLLKLSRFLDVQAADGAISSTTKDKISKLIKHKLERTSKKVLHSAGVNAPAPVIPAQDLDDLDLTVLDPLEVARQITLMDEQSYKSIAPSECMNQAWNKPAICNEVSPNIIRMISRFNATSNWAARLIVTEANMRKRKSITTRIIKLAQRLRELHNYHSLMALIAALESAPVARLRKTWDAIDSAYVKQFQELRGIMSAEGSYKAFRAVIKTEDPPVIPYIGVYLADLTFIEDGNPSKIQHETLGELINFGKMKLLDGVIQDINMYQMAPYKLEPVPKIQILLGSAEDIKMTDKDLFEHSLKSEPRAAK